MSILWGKEGLTWLFYVPSFICGTLIGGAVAFVFLKRLSATGLLKKFQTMLSGTSFDDKTSIISNAASIAAFGPICYIVLEIPTSIFSLTSPVWHYVSRFAIVFFVAAAIVYYISKVIKKEKS